uniref:NADH-ubiquinone oxidoreductase chain 4L n=1 Tax=Physoderes impexa TaxID=1239050 RepID=A0A7I6HL45_9HEMI|nr:NADH dehydrogenase subunit 4L [Physoderes impexa]AGO28087.1 NADH dehydrogenase subunit 4L [Physoderes impexa]
MYTFVYTFVLLSGLYVFCSMHKHLLLTLLSLEFLVLGLYMMFIMFLYFYKISYYFLLIFLTFSVCEGVLGLGILVGVIRVHGNDNVSSISILGW